MRHWTKTSTTWVLAICLGLGMGILPAHAETIEIVTYYPAQANMGEANLNAASIGMMGDEPGPGELFIESRARIGDPGDVGDRTDSSLSIFSSATNNTNGFINVYVTEPFALTGPDSQMRILTGAKRNQADNTRLDWTMAIGPGDEPTFSLFRANRPDGADPDFETPFTAAWNGFIGINNPEPEAMLHIGSPLPSGLKGDILLENPRGIQVRDKDGTPQYILTYSTANNTILQQNAATGSIQLNVRNTHNTGNIQFRTGVDNTPSNGIDETLKMQIANDGSTTIFGNLEVQGAFKQSGFIYAGNGDTDGNGALTALDALIMINLINSGSNKFSNQAQQERADFNGDGIISGADIIAVVDILNTQGNGVSAGALPRVIDRATLPQLAQHLVVDRSGNLGVGTATPRGGLYNNGISQPNGNNTGIINANDIYLRSTGQWLSQSGGGGIIQNMGNITIQLRYTGMHTTSTRPYADINFNSPNPTIIGEGPNNNVAQIIVAGYSTGPFTGNRTTASVGIVSAVSIQEDNTNMARRQTSLPGVRTQIIAPGVVRVFLVPPYTSRDILEAPGYAHINVTAFDLTK